MVSVPSVVFVSPEKASEQAVSPAIIAVVMIRQAAKTAIGLFVALYSIMCFSLLFTCSASSEKDISVAGYLGSGTTVVSIKSNIDMAYFWRSSVESWTATASSQEFSEYCDIFLLISHAKGFTQLRIVAASAIVRK